jgi:hypothetical protein
MSVSSTLWISTRDFLDILPRCVLVESRNAWTLNKLRPAICPVTIINQDVAADAAFLITFIVLWRKGDLVNLVHILNA